MAWWNLSASTNNGLKMEVKLPDTTTALEDLVRLLLQQCTINPMTDMTITIKKS